MKVLSNLEFKNSTYILNKFTDFPENPSEGTVIFKENGLYIYSTNITSGNLEWLNILDFTRVNSSYKFEQGTENIEWVINHNLNTQDLFVIVYDSDGNKQVESEIQFQNDNEIKLIFSEPISGKALLFGASVVSSPSNMYTKEEIDELLKNIDTSGGGSNIILPENGTDGQVLVKDSSTESGLNWSDKIAGETGKSAFDIAKDSGFEGTEDEWLKSLKGIDGISYGNFSGIDWTNQILLELQNGQVTGSYGYLTTIAPQDGYITLKTTFNSINNGYFVALNINDRDIDTRHPHTAANRFGCFVSKNDVIKLKYHLSLTLGTSSCEFYQYKQVNTYSTDEQVVGVWIDGKPIYRRVYTGTYSFSPTNNTVIIDNVNDWNVSHFVKIEGTGGIIGTTGSSACRDLSYYTSAGNGTWGVQVNTGDLCIKNTANHNIYYNIFIEYIKTTD